MAILTKDHRYLTILGAFFAALAVVLSLLVYWSLGREVRDSLVLTAYAIDVPPGREYRFGYGGERQEDQVDILFQGREMSNVAFVIARAPEGQLTITGRDDRIRVGRDWFESGQAISLEDDDRVETRGALGRARFRVSFIPGSNKVHLNLDTPLYRDLQSSVTRVVFGPRHEPVPAAGDELFFRTEADSQPLGKSFRVTVRDGALSRRIEHDISDAMSNEPLASLADLRSGETWEVGSLRVVFRHYAGVRWFGLAWTVTLALLGLILLAGPQVRWPDDPLILGTSAFLVTIGFCLSAHSYLLTTHRQYFPWQLQILFFALVLLFWLRFPFGSPSAIEEAGGVRPLVLSAVAFVIVYLLIVRPFEPYQGLFALLKSALFAFLVFVALGLVVAGSTFGIHKALNWLTNFPWSFYRLIVMFLVALLPVAFIVVTWALGGREVLPLGPGRGLHLPTLLLPFLIIVSAIFFSAARQQKKNQAVILILIFIALASDIIIYRWISGDNGGLFILTVGLLSVCWLTWRHWLLPTLLTVLLLLAVSVAAYLSKPERFEIAVGQGQALQYYDEARNLRMARDLAQAGGWGGLGTDLVIPSGLRNNLHNDLIAAYVVGYFGLGVMLAVVLAYFFLFDGLWRGLYVILQAYSDDQRDAPSQQLLIRQILVLVSLALVVVSIIQTLWMITAPLQRTVPMTGLDLQPISISTISLLSFMVVLLGSAALAHTSNKVIKV